MNALLLWWGLGALDFIINCGLYLTLDKEAQRDLMRRPSMWAIALALAMFLGPIALAVTASQHFKREQD